MARVSKTSPFRVRSHAEVRANTNTDSEKKEDMPSEPIPEEENSSSSTSGEEENSSSSTSDEEENDHEKGKGKRPMKRKVRKQQIRSVIGLSYSPEKAKEVRKVDAAFNRKAAAAKYGRGRGKGRGRPTKERSVNVGRSNAERKRKGKEKETDVFEVPDTESEEVCKKFRMDKNDDDDSGEDGGGAGIGAQNLSNQVY